MDEKPTKPAAPKPPIARRASRIPVVLPPYKPPVAAPAGTTGFVSSHVKTGGVVSSGSTAARADDAPPASAVHPFDHVSKHLPLLRRSAPDAPASTKGEGAKK